MLNFQFKQLLLNIEDDALKCKISREEFFWGGGVGGAWGWGVCCGTTTGELS